LTKAKPIRKRQTHPLVREGVTDKYCDHKGSAEKKISGRDPLGAWYQDELIGDKSAVVKELWL
jgi:hypothetical protein